MSVNMEPEVGRIIMPKAHSLAFFPWCERGGRITKVSGQRVYYVDARGKEKHVHGWAAVVDTEQEAEALLSFAVSGKEQIQKLYDSLEQQQASVIASLSSPPGKASQPPAGARVRRARGSVGHD